MQNQSKRKISNHLLLLILILLISATGFCFNGPFQTLSLLIASISLAVLLIFLTTIFFGTPDTDNGIWEYVISEDGRYSLSRLQALLWAVLIIAFQLQIILALSLRHPTQLQIYQPVLSASSMWLLGLSLTSYVAVKAIRSKNLRQHPGKQIKRRAEWSQLLVSHQGLDFSRCQMLLWTLLAAFVFLVKCFYFSDYLLHAASTSDVLPLLEHMETDTTLDKHSHLPLVPFLPWSFIVLMGLSQGAYVGKKLVPDWEMRTNSKLRKLSV